MKLCESMGVNYKNAGSLEGLIVELLCSIYSQEGMLPPLEGERGEKGLIVDVWYYLVFVVRRFGLFFPFDTRE